MDKFDRIYGLHRIFLRGACRSRAAS